MLNQIEALRMFCVTAETLQFKEAAARLSVSPPVVTRVVAELEAALGEALFQRSTRQVRLTDFGEHFLPQAQQLLAQSERLFARRDAPHAQQMQGIVRIAMPERPDNPAILAELLQRLQPWPGIVLDWRIDTLRLNVVQAQIDMGLRVGVAADSRLIVRPLGTVQERIVAAPALLAQLGKPASLQDLQARYPLANLLDANTGRPWPWRFGDDSQLAPHQLGFVSNDMASNLQAALSGRCVALLLDWVCRPHLASGALLELFADTPKVPWPVYLYRPQRNVTPVRVQKVFELLTEVLQARA